MQEEVQITDRNCDPSRDIERRVREEVAQLDRYLNVGCEVAFSEQPGPRGPQASTVRMLGTHRYAPR